MRRLSLLLTALAIALPFYADDVASQQFEGIIRERMIMVPPDAFAGLLGDEPSPANMDEVFALDMDLLMAAMGPGGGQVIERTLYVSGQKLRVEVDVSGLGILGGSAMILDRDAGQVTVLVPAMRAYMVLDEALLRDQLGMLTGRYANTWNLSVPSVSPLGSRTIAGVEADGYEIRAGDDAIMRAWTAPELRNALPIEPPAGDPLASVAEIGLPVRTQVLARLDGPLASLYGSGGYFYMASEVLSAERTAVDPAQFTVPPDYTPVDAGGAIPGAIAPPFD